MQCILREGHKESNFIDENGNINDNKLINILMNGIP